MLRISKLADYGTVIMAIIARDAKEGLNAKTIAEKTHVNLPTISKLLKQLTCSGLLISQRGVKGGYRLAKPAETISLADVLMAIEGDFSLTECSSDQPNGCSVEAFCVMRHNWQLISYTIKQLLSSTYLSDMIQPFYPQKVQK